MMGEILSFRSDENGKRRWFANDYFDLIVWIGEKNTKAFSHGGAEARRRAENLIKDQDLQYFSPRLRVSAQKFVMVSN
ncbi:MAG TPA: hypothetical protein VLG39_04765 [Nitrospirota bacterium]|nr:hypothetical protein [Nitrospirota bacterium]